MYCYYLCRVFIKEHSINIFGADIYFYPELISLSDDVFAFVSIH